MTHTDHQGQMLSAGVAPWWSMFSHSGSATQSETGLQLRAAAAALLSGAAKAVGAVALG